MTAMKTQKIHLLDPLQAQQIAAGEVVERPANIVKELVENSIDAGATVITIRIEKAGKELIAVTDNGCGMNALDARRCFARHATSKLSKVEELTSLNTFGFRGEALASIAAVGRVTLTTKEQEEPLLGTQITYHHGLFEESKEVSSPAGTSIVIKDLFGTLPVRKTFLKQDDTEWNQIQAAIQGIALTNLHISFMLYKDGVLAIEAPAVSTLKDRVTQLWNHILAAQLTPLSAQEKEITVEGLISLPPYARYGKDMIMFWVNNRLVKNSDIVKAITKGYLQALPPGKYPAAFLSITVDPVTVDVNIHPRKEEVRFTRPGLVASCIQKAITTALEASVARLAAPPLHIPEQTPFAHTPLPHNQLFNRPFAPDKIFQQPLAAPLIPPLPAQKSMLPPPISHISAQAAPVQQPTLHSSATIIGQMFATYILIELEEELIIIDQHAAHERILYHQFTTRFTRKEGTQLLFPETIQLESAQAVSGLVENSAFFAAQGIAFEQTGPMHITITSSPPHLQKESLTSVLTEAAQFITTHAFLDPELFRQKLNEHVHSHLACKLAVKAGDILTHTAMEDLVKQLLATPNRFMCVHGRPTMWLISRFELEKRFKRRG